LLELTTRRLFKSLLSDGTSPNNFMRVALALVSSLLATGEAITQTASNDVIIKQINVAQNSDIGSSRQVVTNVGTHVLVLSPKASTRPSETHSALALSNTSFAGDITFRGRVKTVQQLRIGSPPNPWECAWLVWNYQGDHFYYLALKTNGWEIGKHDRAFKGHQKFLRTGIESYALGVWYEFEITQKENEISLRIDDVDIVTFRDEEHPYTAGKLGFYTEDAEIRVGSITSPFHDDFEDYPFVVQRGDGGILKNWFMPFLGHGYGAIVMGKK
jgi:hypothetical protein